jgi:hypothetical protein
MMQRAVRHYLVLKPNADLMRPYRAGDHSGVFNHIVRGLRTAKAKTDMPFRISALQSLKIGPGITRAKQSRADVTSEAHDDLDNVVAQLEVDESGVEQAIVAAGMDPETVVAASPDLPFAAADHWCSAEASSPVFGDRVKAEQLLQVDYLRTNNADGANVNVVIVDQGLDAQRLGARFGGGWPVNGRQPGTMPELPSGSLTYGMLLGGHGMMIAHNILSIAPQATLFDMPLVPWAITDVPAYLSTADAALRRMLRDIRRWQRNGAHPGPWVIINPWGIYDASSDPQGDYTNNPKNPFNRLIKRAVAHGIDVVFPAGNCGQFCPDRRCGASNVGPGRDILGANSLAEVITVGAVRVDTMWLGYSSQGPGQPRLAREKPDVCAPSQFHETGDAFRINTGTSAACGLTAGIVTALRSRWNANALAPAALKQILIDTAFQPQGSGWSERTGHGIVNAKAAFEKAAAM